MNLTCHGCGKTNELQGIVGRASECEHCGADLHCCYQCRFHDPSAAKECREPQADVPREKDRSNFCEFFEVGMPRGKSGADMNAAKAAFEALFKKK